MSKWLILCMIGLIMLAPFFVPEPLVAQTTPDGRFGMTEVFWLPDEARDLGVGWERILFYWRELQPEGPGDWNTLHVREEWLAQANAQGRTIVGLIKNTAPWASLDGTEAGVPKGLYLSLDDPDNLWAGFVQRLAEYYSARNVHHWIIWNEPEIEAGVYGFEFAGTVADYYQMLKSAYMVVKEVDPQAVVHLAGLTWWHDPTFLDQLLALAAEDPGSADNDYFFDVISLHIYFRTETVKTIIDEVNVIQERYGLEKPIWINETNAPPNRDPEWPVDRPRFDVDLEQQAWFVLQAMALGFASGAERISVYKLLDIHLPPGGESFGLVRPDYSRRPAYDAYKLATSCFGLFKAVTLEEDPVSFHVAFERPAGLSHIAWSRTITATTVQITANSDSAKLISWTEAPIQVEPIDGSYLLELPGQRCRDDCIIGGEPVLLVEEYGGRNHVEQCITWAKDRLTSHDSTEDSELRSIPESPDLRLEERVWETNATVPPVAPATPVAAQIAIPTMTPTGVGTTTSGQAISVQPHQNSVAAEAMASPTVTSAEPESVPVATLGDAGNEAQESEALSETIGLWFIGAGIGVALGMAFYWRRHMWRHH
ncbi:MAG: hypothetical protein JSW55_07720 [Chloroflexota bacterium]|nr:MAG: hypothetical protein JSW55_07720 [Chloroflexota bacterium]